VLLRSNHCTATQSQNHFARNRRLNPAFPAKEITSKPTVQIQNQGLGSSSRATMLVLAIKANALPNAGLRFTLFRHASEYQPEQWVKRPVVSEHQSTDRA
jgi:hypothetical protein